MHAQQLVKHFQVFTLMTNYVFDTMEEIGVDEIDLIEADGTAMAVAPMAIKETYTDALERAIMSKIQTTVSKVYRQYVHEEAGSPRGAK